MIPDPRHDDACPTCGGPEGLVTTPDGAEHLECGKCAHRRPAEPPANPDCPCQQPLPWPDRANPSVPFADIATPLGAQLACECPPITVTLPPGQAHAVLVLLHRLSIGDTTDPFVPVARRLYMRLNTGGLGAAVDARIPDRTTETEAPDAPMTKQAR